MYLRAAFITAVVLSVGSLALGTVSATAAPGDNPGISGGDSPPDGDDGGDDENLCKFFNAYEVEGTLGGVLDLPIEQYFSRDREITFDGPVENRTRRVRERYRSQCDDSEVSEAELAAIQSDVTFAQPPRYLSRFNRQSFQRLLSTGSDYALVPSGVSVTNSTFITDAYVVVHSVMPSTTLIASNERRIRYVAPTSRVQYFGEFRVTTPPSDTTGPIRQSTMVLGSRRVANCIRFDRNVSQGCRGSTMNVSGQKVSRLVNMSGATGLAAVQTIRVEAINQTRRCTDWNSTRRVCEGRWHRNRTTVVDQVTVADAMEVEVIRQPNVTMRSATFPTGRHRVHIELHNRFSLLEFGTASRVFTPYMFATWSDPRWDNVSVRGPGELPWDLPRFHPVRIYAMPSWTGTNYVNRSTEDSWSFESGRIQRVVPRDRRYQFNVTELPPAVNVSVANTTYRYPQEVWLRGLRSFDPTSVVGVSMIRGVNATVDSESDLNESSGVTLAFHKNVTQPRLFAREVADLRGESGFEVVLETANGTPINTSNRSGYITVDGRRLNTTNGTARIRLKENRPAVYRYRPQPWYVNESQRAFVATRFVYEPGPPEARTSIGLIISSLLTLVVPVTLALLLLDQVPGLDVWPPWEVITDE